MQAIWKDDYYVFNVEKLTYYITDYNGNVLYNGKAYALPGDSVEGAINISRVCANYLFQDLPRLSTITASTVNYVHSGATGTFKLYDGGSGNTLLNTYDYVYDYSFDPTISYSGVTNMSKPINGHYAANMFKLETKYSGGTVSTTITRPGGDYCGDYALVYLNRQGGWDSFLFEGKCKQTDDFDRKNYETDINNNYRDWKRSRVDYRNSITRGWELTTGWLKDTEAETLSTNLLSSNQVFLQNLNTLEIVPVHIEDSSSEHKHFLWERKPICYTITVKSDNSEYVR